MSGVYGFIAMLFYLKATSKDLRFYGESAVKFVASIGDKPIKCVFVLIEIKYFNSPFFFYETVPNR